jgi:hypothetical protein
LDIHFTFGTSYERAAPLAEKNSSADLSDSSVRGAARRHFYLGKWRSSFVGSSDGKMNVQSACALNTQYKPGTGTSYNKGIYNIHIEFHV